MAEVVGSSLDWPTKRCRTREDTAGVEAAVAPNGANKCKKATWVKVEATGDYSHTIIEHQITKVIKQKFVKKNMHLKS